VTLIAPSETSDIKTNKLNTDTEKTDIEVKESQNADYDGWNCFKTE
jgi:hypothetical protein